MIKDGGAELRPRPVSLCLCYLHLCTAGLRCRAHAARKHHYVIQARCNVGTKSIYLFIFCLVTLACAFCALFSLAAHDVTAKLILIPILNDSIVSSDPVGSDSHACPPQNIIFVLLTF